MTIITFAGSPTTANCQARAFRWATAALLALITSLTFCAGARAAVPDTTPTKYGTESGGPADMRVTNATDRAISVWVTKMKGSNVVGHLAGQIAANEQRYGRMDDDTVSNTTFMTVCFNHKPYSHKWETTGHKWNDLYVFAKPFSDLSGQYYNLIVTGTGGGDNRTLTPDVGDETCY